MDITDMMEVPGASDIPSLGVLSRLQSGQSDQSNQQYSPQAMQSDLMNRYMNSMSDRATARSDMDKYYQDAINSLKTPVQDNSWLHLALGALKPTLPWDNGVINGAIAAENEEQRANQESLKTRILANKLGMDWQHQRMSDIKDESDKLMARLAVGDRSAQNVGAFARQATSLYTQQFESYRKQAETMTDIDFDKKDAWIRKHAMDSTRAAMKDLAPAWEKAGVPVDTQEKLFGTIAPTLQQSQDIAKPDNKSINIVSTNIPPDVQSEIDKQIARMNANPNDRALRENTLKRLREISTQYPATPEQLKRFGKDVQPNAGDNATTPPRIGDNNISGKTIADVVAEAAGKKKSAEVSAESAGESGKILYESYGKLKEFPRTVQTLNDAMDAWSRSKDQFGKGAEMLNSTKSFLNNRLGLGFAPEKVASAQEFRAAMGRYASSLTRQTDSQPAQKLFEMIQQYVGSLENDPQAIPKIFKALYDLSRLDVETHNKNYETAIKGKDGFKSYFPLTIDTPALITHVGIDEDTGRRVARYSDRTAKFLD